MKEAIIRHTHKVEIPLLIVALIGGVFKLMNLQGAAILLILSLAPLAFWYFIYAIAGSGQYQGKAKLAHIVFYIALDVGCLAILYAILNWPGTQVMVYTGLGLIIIGEALAFLYLKEDERATFLVKLKGGIVLITMMLLFRLSMA